MLNVFISDKPSSPHNLHVTKVYNDYVSLGWEEPEADGGAPISGYVIEKKDVKQNSWINAGHIRADDLKFTVKKLFEGTQYLFRVAAENKIGVGDFVELENPVTAKLPFGKLKVLLSATSMNWNEKLPHK